MVDALKIEQRWGRSKLPEPVIIASLPHSTESMWTRKDIQVNDTLSRIYAEGSVTDASGHVHKFKDTTNPVQGRHLYNLVKENRYTRTMEIGLAMGASAAWICQAHHELHMGGRHLAIDPNQTSQYASIGLHLSQLCGVREHLSLLEMPSYRGLPRLLEQVLAGEQAPFHLIYIDGWHTFDYTLVDFFYADLLLQVNGIIVLDDVRHKPVRSCLNYLATNYSHYELVNETPCYNSNNERISTQATFIKRSPDHRTWNHHARFEG